MELEPRPRGRGKGARGPYSTDLRERKRNPRSEKVLATTPGSGVVRPSSQAEDVTSNKVTLVILYKVTMDSPSRSWCITWNNPPVGFIERKGVMVDVEPGELIPENPGIKYAVWQMEVGSTGTSHLQGYIELIKPQRMSWIKKLLGANVHCEKRRGTPEEARAYCMKEDTRVAGPFEIGKWEKVGQGRRSDLHEVCQAAMKGLRMDQAFYELGAGVLRYAKEFNMARMLKAAHEDRQEPRVIVHYGASGTGKTYDAVNSTGRENVFVKELGEWWDGYDLHKTVVIDEFKGWIPRTTLLRALDKYPMNVPVKGGFVPFVPETIYITSNFHPSEWYDDKFGSLTPLYRRITEVWRYEEDGSKHKEELPIPEAVRNGAARFFAQTAVGGAGAEVSQAARDAAFADIEVPEDE